MSNGSRHKSCLACIQTKRKCDRTWPKCQRCIVRGSECQYIGRNRRQSQQEFASSSIVDQSASPSEPIDEQPSSVWSMEQYWAEPTSFLPVPSACWDTALFEFPSHFNFAGMQDDNSLIINGMHEDTASQHMPSSADPDPIRAITSDAKLQARVEYVAKRLTLIPGGFVQKGQTMFIHRTQFQQRHSTALQDAMSACALYCMKGVANQALVFQNLEYKCQQLIAKTNPLLASKNDLLSALQALLLYQIMRLFDGDIYLRAHAETDEAIAVLWARQLNVLLCSTTQSTVVAPASPDMALVATDSNLEWRSWLIDESIRRTVIITFMLKGVYNFLRLGHDSPINTADLSVFFTAQAALWDAQSVASWCKAREEMERLEVWVMRWDEGLAKAKGADLEELGVLVMTMLWGPDATRTWLGEDLTIKYGLGDSLEGCSTQL